MTFSITLNDPERSFQHPEVLLRLFEITYVDNAQTSNNMLVQDKDDILPMED